MDKSYNFDKIVNIKFNNDSNKYNSFFIQPKINSGIENQSMIYLNNRKRNREIIIQILHLKIKLIIVC